MSERLFLTIFLAFAATSLFAQNVEKGNTEKFDTTTTLYAGISFEKAGKRDSAAIFYGRLADAKITHTNGKDMRHIYKWLVDYYNQKNDVPNTAKYIALGKWVYPDDLFWLNTELDNLLVSGPKDSVWAKFDEITAHFPKNYMFFFNYGRELYRYASDTSAGKAPTGAADLTQRAQTELTKCLEIQPDYPQAAFLLGQISYNQGMALRSQANQRIAARKKFDEAIPYLEKVDQDFSSRVKLKIWDKVCLKDAYDLLITIYEQKYMKDKVDAYTVKFDEVDTKR